MDTRLNPKHRYLVILSAPLQHQEVLLPRAHSPPPKEPVLPQKTQFSALLKARNKAMQSIVSNLCPRIIIHADGDYICQRFSEPRLYALHN